MDSLHFDAYTSYSDSSAPRTPSPHDMHYPSSNDHHFKPSLDIEPRIYSGEHDDGGSLHGVHDGGVQVVGSDPAYWNPAHQQPAHPFAFNPSRGSLLQELYDHDIAEQQQQPAYLDQGAESTFNGAENWPQNQQQQQHNRHHDYTLIRRATFPYVRQDRDDGVAMQQYPPFMHQQGYPSRQDALYGEPLPLSDSQGDGFIPSLSSSPHPQYHDFDDNTSIKLEDNQPLMVPSQTPFYRPPSSSSCHPMTMSYLSPHTGLPVQHTDDAASKETQYLRRRCFNCHTTEPPSWRRSTLNPGKIVCNKCGLYERTHLRPRPLRFDELRAGNKARKQSKGTVSPKAKMALVKKEPREFGLVRRSSVSSSSSVHSGSGASDWDDNVSVYSAGSAPPTSFNSPNAGAFPLSRDSQSPPRDGGIRLPNAPLSDIASMHSSPTPRKAHTAPYYSPPSSANGQQQQSYYRRTSVSEQRPETTGWQTVASPQTSLLDLGQETGPAVATPLMQSPPSATAVLI